MSARDGYKRGCNRTTANQMTNDDHQDGRSYKGYELRRTLTGEWIIPSLSSRTYESANAAKEAIDAAGLDAR